MIYKDVMVDLETLGTNPNSAIIAIGAVAFDAVGIATKFYIEINRDSCRSFGLQENPDTLAWWSKQAHDARELIDRVSNPEHGYDLQHGLEYFAEWLAQHTVLDSVRVWGNGSDFDNSMLTFAYNAVGRKTPWKFYNNRCYRTLKNLYPEVKFERTGIHHNALHDAITQAEHAVKIFTKHCYMGDEPKRTWWQRVIKFLNERG